jgi:S1-C subfamily serine protease
VIAEIDGKAVSSPSSMYSVLDEHEIGDRVRLTLLREGKKIPVNVQLQGQQTRARQ